MNIEQLAEELLPHVANADDWRAAIETELERRNLHLDPPEYDQVAEAISYRLFGLGPLTVWLSDQDITDITVNQFDEIWLLKSAGWELANNRFTSHAELLDTIQRVMRFANASLTTVDPIKDVRLPNGGPRVCVAIPPAVPDGTASLSLRLYRRTRMKLGDLVRTNPPTLTQEMVLFLASCVLARKNILVSGGTGSGKTTLLSTLIARIDQHERLILIEDTPELEFAGDGATMRRNVQRLLANRDVPALTPDALLRASLRMKPDRIIIGECRGPETLTMLAAMNTGHDGSMTSVHASSTDEAISRLETLALSAHSEMPYQALRSQIGSAINLIVQIERNNRSGARYVVEIAEVLFEQEQLLLSPIYRRRDDGTFEAINQPTFWSRIEHYWRGRATPMALPAFVREQRSGPP